MTFEHYAEIALLEHSRLQRLAFNREGEIEMDAFEAQAAKLKTAQNRLNSFSKKLNDPKFFYPVIKCEWDRAFDAREKEETKLCRMDRDRYAAMFPGVPNDR